MKGVLHLVGHRSPVSLSGQLGFQRVDAMRTDKVAKETTVESENEQATAPDRDSLHSSSPELIPPSLGPSADGCVARQLHTPGMRPPRSWPSAEFPSRSSDQLRRARV